MPGWARRELGAQVRPPSPIQTSTSPVLIGREPLAFDEFVGHIVQRLIIELELPLEGAIRQAAPLAQEGDHLIHDRDKVHRVSSLAWCSASVLMGECIIA